MKIFNLRDGAPTTAKRVDRSTPFGNPFVIGRDGTRDEVCDKFEAWVKTQPQLVALARLQLRGQDLACWCAPQRCHAETWLRVANEQG